MNAQKKILLLDTSQISLVLALLAHAMTFKPTSQIGLDTHNTVVKTHDDILEQLGLKI